jgi:hypothetical protein
MRHLLTGAAICLALVACGDDDDDNGPSDVGVFTANLSSGSTAVASFSGEAIFAVSGSEFVIGLIDEAGPPDGVILIGREAGGRPEAGTYEVEVTPTSGSDDMQAAAAFEYGGSQWLCQPGETGTLTITSSSSSSVDGSLAVVMLCDQDASGELVVLSLQASFEATVGTVPVP